MLLFISYFILSLFVGIDGQYGQPMVGGNDRFSFECQQTEVDVISLPNNREYEVIAGKSFAFNCEFFVDTRICDHNPRESGCEGIEVKWFLPEDLTRLEKEKGLKRETVDTVIENNPGYSLYKTKLRLNDVGLIHNGHYSWELNLRFEMRTVFKETFKITIIDMLQMTEPCVYDDSCQSGQCRDRQCVVPTDKAIPWIVVGTLLAVILVITLAIILIVVFVNRKHQRYINRRF